jgi:hypothetical protein
MNTGLLVVKNNTDLANEEAARNQSIVDANKPLAPMVSNLSGYLRKQWEAAKREKNKFEQQILRNQRAKAGEYDPEKLAEIKAIGAPEIYMMITDAKCRSAEAWVKDIVQQPGDIPPFAVEPTPIPTVPPEIEQQFEAQFYQEAVAQAVNAALSQGMPLDANTMMGNIQAMLPDVQKALKKAILDWSKERCEEMTKQINDQFVEGGWFKAFSEAIPDIIMHTGIIKGPTPRKEKIKTFGTDTNGRLSMDYKDEIVQTWERKNPLDIYPGAGGATVNDRYLFDKSRYKPSEIAGFIGLPGFIEKEIRAVLQECRDGKIFKEWTEIDQDRALAEGKNPEMIFDWEEIHVLEYWGEVQGKMLIDWDTDGSAGMKEIAKDLDIYYPINAFMIGTHVIKAILNDDPMGHKPYSKCSFVENPNCFWGKGLSELIEDVQRACNASARALLYNVGMASGPQVEVNEERLADGEQANLVPWKRWFVTNDIMLHGGKAIEFYQPTFVAEKLIQVFNFYLKLADEHSGIPAYAHGDPQVGGAGNTASGLSMLMTQAARGIKLLVKNMDEKMIEDSVQRQFEWNVKQKKFRAIVGDVRVKAKGTASLIAKEQEATRMAELLSITANPLDAQIMGQEGRRNLLKKVVQTHEADPAEIVPDMPVPMMAQGGASGPQKGATLNAAGEPAQGTDFQTVYGRGGAAALPMTMGPAGP